MIMRHRSFLTLAATAMFVGIQPVHASSEEAWSRFEAEVTRSCLIASRIPNGRASTIVGFDDRVGKVAMLVSDRTRGSSVSKLCLYDKRARKAFVDEAEGWSAPPQRP